MSIFHDKTGLRFGRLFVLARSGSDRRGNALHLCLCACGQTTVVQSGNLTTGNVKSCGCLKRELNTARIIALNTTHGQTGTSTWHAWNSMIQRCCNPRHKSYARYGGRGVGIDDPNWFSYQKFFDEMGEKPPGHDLHRKDNDKGYSKDNCIWLPHSEHMRLHAKLRAAPARAMCSA